MAKCQQKEPHRRSFNDGSWEVGGWVPGTHLCLCGGDGVVSLSLRIGGGGLSSNTLVNLCRSCAIELRNGIDCQLDTVICKTCGLGWEKPQHQRPER